MCISNIFLAPQINLQWLPTDKITQKNHRKAAQSGNDVSWRLRTDLRCSFECALSDGGAVLCAFFTWLKFLFFLWVLEVLLTSLGECIPLHFSEMFKGNCNMTEIRTGKAIAGREIGEDFTLMTALCVCWLQWREQSLPHYDFFPISPFLLALCEL